MADLTSKDPEIGATGVKVYGGVLYNREDYNVNLQNQAGMLLYDKIRKSDPEAFGGIARLAWPLVAAETHIEPPKTGKRAQEITDFVSQVLLKREIYGTGIEDTSTDFVRQTATMMLAFGFMAWEKVFGVDKKGRQVYAKLAARMPSTFWEFQFKGEGGAFSGALQRAWSPRTGRLEDMLIPADKIALFPFGREGDNYWGSSILRSAYPAWDMKRKVLWLVASSLERFGHGVLELHATEDVSPEEKRAAEDAAAEFRSHEKNFLYTSNKFTATFHHPPSGQSQGVEFAKYLDQQIERAMLVEFMATGTAETGSRAVVASKVQLLMVALQSFAKMIEDSVTQQLIVDLVDRNFGPQEEYPKFRFEDLSKMSGLELTELVAPLKEKGLIKYDRKLEEFLRNVNDLPEIDDSTREEGLAPTITSPNAVGGDTTSTPGDPGNATKGTQEPAPAPTAKPKAAKDPNAAPDFWRGPLAHEQHVGFADMKRYLDSEPGRIWQRYVLPIRKDQIKALADAVANASEADLSQDKLPRPNVKEMADVLFQGLLGAYTKGRDSVLQDAIRQRKGITAADRPMRFDVTDPESDAEDQQLYDDYPPDPSRSQRSAIKRMAETLSVTMMLALIREATTAGQSAKRQAMDAADTVASVRSALEALSEPVVQAEIGSKVTSAFTAGRIEQGQAMAEEVTSVFYSAMMDSGTCDPCSALDGSELELESYDSMVPNANCDGGIDRCRCEPVFVFRPGTSQEAA